MNLVEFQQLAKWISDRQKEEEYTFLMAAYAALLSAAQANKNIPDIPPEKFFSLLREARGIFISEDFSVKKLNSWIKTSFPKGTFGVMRQVLEFARGALSNEEEEEEKS